MEKPSNKKQFAFLFLIFLFVLQVFLYENDIYTSSSTACFKDTSYIELVHQPDIPEIPEFPDDPSILMNPDTDLLTCVLQNTLFIDYNLLPLQDIRKSDVIIENCRELPSRHIISILKKKNNCHQSSDDEPFPHTLS